MFSKHTLDAGFGQFINILQWVCWKRGVYFALVDKDYTYKSPLNAIAILATKNSGSEFILALNVGIRFIVM